MTKLEKSLLYVSGGLVLFILILGGVSFVMWLEAHDSAIKAEAKVEALQQQREQVQQQTQQNVAQDKTERKEQDTPQKQVEYISQNIRVPMSLQKPVNDIDPPLVTFPQTGLPVFADYVEAHKVTLHEFEGCQKQLKICDAQLSALKSARKTTFWNRAKWFAIGGAAGAGVIAVTRK